jgi:hypothetical protein
VNGFTFLDFDRQPRVFDAGGNVTPGLQVHLHALRSGVEERQMFKIFRVEVSPELPVDVDQDIPVEIASSSVSTLAFEISRSIRSSTDLRYWQTSSTVGRVINPRLPLKFLRPAR